MSRLGISINPNTTTLSPAHHMATCVAIENNISIHNPENIED
nr:3864_t:CDS:2 [Entrophospora candida]